MTSKLLSLSMAIGLAAVFGFAGTAKANLYITVNGVVEPGADPTNSEVSFTGAVGTFNLNVVTGVGVASFNNSGELLDVSSFNLSSSGVGSITVNVTETGLTGSSPSDLYGLFTGTFTNATVTRSYYFDPTDSGALTTLLGSTITAGASSFSDLVTLSGPYSITEDFSVNATGPGANLSADDPIFVPEPMSIAMLASGVFGLGLIRRRTSRRG